MVALSEDKKKKIYKRLLEVANHYYFCISNKKKFLLIDEFYKSLVVSCRLKDFVHLTGIKFDFPDARFFKLFLDRHLRIDNIKTEQKYNFRSIMQKLNNLDEMCLIFEFNTNERLILKEIRTQTRIYPYGICSNNCVVCLDTPETYHPHSIRNENQTRDFVNISNIIFVFKKEEIEQNYSNCVYIAENYSISDIPASIINKYKIIT